ncbi:hypothetical protein BXZ70DRAFT_906506 [Cristinia sonorae]|uniref:Uncharacterized protein n=1 Tax=Cristinia sonorae TaxID=1940300 RepID=A0A8K0UQ99_9AGAR|nr:hypothetical protein BXZ70DRAFT_906506 [Cristinia sonorae]
MNNLCLLLWPLLPVPPAVDVRDDDGGHACGQWEGGVFKEARTAGYLASNLHPFPALTALSVLDHKPNLDERCAKRAKYPINKAKQISRADDGRLIFYDVGVISYLLSLSAQDALRIPTDNWHLHATSAHTMQLVTSSLFHKHIIEQALPHGLPEKQTGKTSTYTCNRSYNNPSHVQHATLLPNAHGATLLLKPNADHTVKLHRLNVYQTVKHLATDIRTAEHAAHPQLAYTRPPIPNSKFASLWLATASSTQRQKEKTKSYSLSDAKRTGRVGIPPTVAVATATVISGVHVSGGNVGGAGAGGGGRQPSDYTTTHSRYRYTSNDLPPLPVVRGRQTFTYYHPPALNGKLSSSSKANPLNVQTRGTPLHRQIHHHPPPFEWMDG